MPLPLSRTLSAPLLAYTSPIKSPVTSPTTSPVTLPVTGPVNEPVTSAVIFPDAALRSILPRTSILKNFDVPAVASTLPSSKPTNLSEAVIILEFTVLFTWSTISELFDAIIFPRTSPNTSSLIVIVANSDVPVLVISPDTSPVTSPSTLPVNTFVATFSTSTPVVSNTLPLISPTTSPTTLPVILPVTSPVKSPLNICVVASTSLVVLSSAYISPVNVPLPTPVNDPVRLPCISPMYIAGYNAVPSPPSKILLAPLLVQISP